MGATRLLGHVQSLVRGASHLLCWIAPPCLISYPRGSSRGFAELIRHAQPFVCWDFSLVLLDCSVMLNLLIVRRLFGFAGLLGRAQSLIRGASHWFCWTARSCPIPHAKDFAQVPLRCSVMCRLSLLGLVAGHAAILNYVQSLVRGGFSFVSLHCSAMSNLSLVLFRIFCCWIARPCSIPYSYVFALVLLNCTAMSSFVFVGRHFGFAGSPEAFFCLRIIVRHAFLFWVLLCVFLYVLVL